MTKKQQNVEQKTRKLLSEEEVYIKKLRKIVNESVTKEKLILKELLDEPHEKLTLGQKISDKVADFGGSWKFIMFFNLIIVCWIVTNIILAKKAFDPFPFILLNLFLSCITALQAPIIMMSQNRSEEKDRERAENDYITNVRAEIKIKSLHKKIDLLLEEQVKTLFKEQDRQTDILDKQTIILKKIEEKFCKE